MLRVLEVDVKALGPGPSFELRDLTDNALPVLDRLSGVVAVLENSLPCFFFSILGPRTGAQATMDSAAILAFYSGALALTTFSSACQASFAWPIQTESGCFSSQDQEVGITFCHLKNKPFGYMLFNEKLYTNW